MTMRPMTMRWRLLLLLASAAPASARAAEAPDPAAQCRDEVARARGLASALPDGDLSRRYAENDLDTAMIELAGGEADDCIDLADRAIWIVRNHVYTLRPGDRLGEPPAEAPE